MNKKTIFGWSCTLALIAMGMPEAYAQNAKPAQTVETAAAAPVCKGEIVKPAELMKPVKVNECLYALHCAGVVPGAVKPYPDSVNAGGKRAGGCATVVNGNLMGRNMDFIINNVPYALVWTDRGEDHYASLGMAVYSPSSEAMLKAEEPGYIEDLSQLMDPAVINTIPSVLLDGVNEKGVACSTLMVEILDGDMTDKGTNPGAPEISYYCACRYVLDHAATAREGAELLKKVNLVNKPEGLLLHWIISDGKETLVVEMHGDKVHVSDRHRVITNYLLTKPEYTLHPYGIERADYLVKHREEADTPDKMQALMSQVRYSKTYSRDTEPFWWSEHYGVDEHGDMTINTPHDNPDFQASITELVEAAKVATPASNPKVIWDTTYSAVYDIAQKTMRVTTHEKFGEYYKAKL